MITKIQTILAKPFIRLLIEVGVLLVISFIINFWGQVVIDFISGDDVLNLSSYRSSIFPLFLLLALIAVSGLFEKLRINSTWNLFGLPFDKSALRDISIAFLGMITVLLIFTGLYKIFGATSEIVFNFHKYYLPTLLAIFCYAAIEEVVFRGIIFQALVDKIGGVYATLILSALFALVHIMNPGMTLIAFSNVLLAGVLFSVIYLKTKSLWLPIFFHFFWNYSTAAILDTPVSGTSFFESMVIFDWNIPKSQIATLMLGGDFGIEGGLIATFLLLLMSSLAWRFLPVSKNIAQKIELRKKSEIELLNGDQL